jgi:hypothetical protein
MMDEQLELLSKVACRELRRNKEQKREGPRPVRHRPLVRLLLGALLGVATRTACDVLVRGVPLDPMSLTSALAMAILVLALWKSLRYWLNEATPWWLQVLLGFSAGVVGPAIMETLMEEIK